MTMKGNSDFKTKRDLFSVGDLGPPWEGKALAHPCSDWFYGKDILFCFQFCKVQGETFTYRTMISWEKLNRRS